MCHVSEKRGEVGKRLVKRRHVGGWSVRDARAEVTEQNSVSSGTVERVGRDHRMWKDVGRVDVLVAGRLRAHPIASDPAPVDASSERRFKVLDGLGDHGIDHLRLRRHILQCPFMLTFFISHTPLPRT